jgi:hypothetical protein
MIGQGAAPELLVPICHPGDTARLYPVVSAGEEPDLAMPVEAESVLHLITSLELAADGQRDEVPYDAYVLAPTIDRVENLGTITGGSLRLALALASVDKHFGVSLSRTTVATGDLDPQGNVLGVEQTGEKIAAAAKRARQNPGVAFLLLLPQKQALGRDAVVDLTPDDIAAALDAPLPTNLECIQVATLLDALRVAFDTDGKVFTNREFQELRGRIYERRFQRREFGPLLQDCRALYQQAQALPDRSRLRLWLEHEALSFGGFAVTTLQRNGEPAEWPELDLDPAVPLRDSLDRKAQALRTARGRELPAEQVAAALNTDAIEEGMLCGAWFDHAIRIAQRGLALVKPRGHHGEHRRLHGSMAQLLWRQALRDHANGSPDAARSNIEEAAQSIAVAWEAAPRDPGHLEDDAARVRVYVLHAGLVAEHLGVELATLVGLGERDSHFRAALGCLYEPEAAGPAPEQDPAWALHVFYLSLATRGEWEAIARHWAAIEDRESPKLPEGLTFGDTLFKRPSPTSPHVCAPLPPDHRIASLLCRAHGNLGDTRSARDIAERWVTLPGAADVRGLLLALPLLECAALRSAPPPAAAWITPWLAGRDLPAAKGAPGAILRDSQRALRAALRASDPTATAAASAQLYRLLGEVPPHPIR